MNKLVRNEERKLTATYFNGVAVAVMAAGTFAPVVAIMQVKSTGLPAPSSLVVH